MHPDLDEKSVGYFIRDEHGDIVGGLIAKLMFTTLHVKYLWISESIRRLGFGKKLIELAQRDANQQGVINVFLDTYSFQAPLFYESLGFKEAGRYNDYPMRGVDKIFYQKTLIVKS
ncbi:GNAT family N-acetyltransferase [Alginatibacterium sediminis]|uniref:GNAT family N-acetyltransferase n=1 Tax=Alginatibacterium sediminis TaxID=2164068 RepID=A0A420EI29_9ALTE|nr:GNAT family N-acetyltransferase [Alginatibacterium sediminis]RKF20355.1 GNAT family N-acetyltransferase [Alginatibacterium sediminis]